MTSSSNTPGEPQNWPPSAREEPAGPVASGQPLGAEPDSPPALPLDQEPASAVDTRTASMPTLAPTTPLRVMVLAALGIVFGDIGTSPLYSLQTVFSIDHNAVEPTPGDVYGVVSLVFWSITVIVSLKYVVLVMRADNDGEGGILALTALLRRLMTSNRAVTAITLLGIIGAGLFYGDSVITPAISVMSAMEGLTVINPEAQEWVVPASLAILTVLFAMQRFGTAAVGRLFGPVMMLWFFTLAALGLPAVITHPKVILGLSPTNAIAFIADRPFIAFIAMGAIVLTITGAEALYADMGHFGARPIRRAWFWVVFPCLIINYLGQSALIVEDPSAISNPFFRLAPQPLILPIVILATMATVIASQAVISGAFSVSHQALHLGLIPRLSVRHTSTQEGGQIYVPVINWALYIGVVVLILGFRSSAALANAYGLAVTGTLILTTVLYGGLAHRGWRWPTWQVAIFVIVIGGVELIFLGANLTKIVHGGWLPVLIAGTVIVIMTTWRWGSALVRQRRDQIEGPLDEWLTQVDAAAIRRVPGQAIFLHTNPATVPLALKETLRFYHVIHEQVAIVTVKVLNVPHVRHVDRITLTDIGSADDGIVAITITLGFNDTQNVPHNLEWSHGLSTDFEYDARTARYFLSVLDVHAQEGRGIGASRKHLFTLISRIAGSRVRSFRLPPSRTAILGGTIYI